MSMMGLSHREERRRSLRWLLDIDDLPGREWVLRYEGTWRSGAGSKGEIAKRARDTRMMMAMRWFYQTPSHLWVDVSVTPTSSSNDAQSSVPHLNKRLTPNPHAQIEVVTERIVDDVGLDKVDHPWLYEQVTRGSNGSSSIKYIAGVVGGIMHLVVAGDNSVVKAGTVNSGNGWLWEDVIHLAESQSLKLKRALDEKQD
jgi:hypothetical protein